MNYTLNLSHALCPNFALNADALIRDAYPKNTTFHDKTTELAAYACQYGFIVDFLNRTTQYGAIAKWVAFGFGLLGCILALITFSRKEYKICVTMMYHRAINAIEIFNALLTLQAAVHAFYGPQLLKYQAWAYFSVYVAEKLRNVLFCWVNLIVLWVSIERVLACLFSAQFEAINRKPVAIAIIGFASVVATAIFLPYGFSVDCAYDNKTAAYKIVASAWSTSTNRGFKEYSLLLSIFMICHAGLLFASSLAALAGLMSMTKRKRALIKAATSKSNSSRELLKQCSLNIQLCILQMCETIPCIANEFLFVYLTVRYSFTSPFLATLPAAPQTLTYDQAVINGNMYYVYLYLAMINGIGVLVSHFCRFYWYLIFSPKVRSSFVAALKRDNQISATITMKSEIKESQIKTITVRENNAVSHC